MPPSHLILQALDQQTALAQAIVTLGRLLPQGMEVRLYRQPDDSRTIVESTHPDGSVTLNWYTDAMQ